MSAAATAFDPITLLADMERRSRSHASNLPQQVETKPTWEGVGFRLGPLRLVAPLAQVTEILTGPRLTRVPGAKPWVRGIANVRGNLLPILDLSALLGGALTSPDRRSRILVAQHQGHMAGFLVGEVLGLKHFYLEEFRRELPKADEMVVRLLEGSYNHDGEQWTVFNFHSLVERPEFQQVAG